MRRQRASKTLAKPPWREVPKVDILLREESRARQRAIRVVLLVLFLGVAYMVGSLYWEGLIGQRDLESARAQIRSTQGELASRQSQLQQLQAQLRGLQQRQQQGEQAGPVKVQWQPVLAALRELLREEGRLDSLEGGSKGELTLVATVADQQALARIHRDLQGSGQPFTVQVMEWQSEGQPFTLTASLQVKP